MELAASPLPVVILISGRGSNLQAIIDAIAEGTLPVDIRAVISNRPQATGLQAAKQAGITTAVVDHTLYKDRQTFDQTLQACIDQYQPALVILAGFMRILSTDFVAHYRGRLLNIHPSLLPDFPGLNTHQRALDAGRNAHGASVHFVTADVDGGPVVLQAPVPVQVHDTADSLAARVLEQEHQLYPLAIRWFAEQRLRLSENGQALLDGAILTEPRQLSATAEKT
ncbi:MAG: phosphoribosylglycinamide formyltransferase, partial [Gammaproteobacteria bacterium]|nr:phosphoribosylglycinamide formyltransferase [Gammaproteobacteria bacterium]